MVVLNSGISWCSGTMNPWVGCTKVSAGCDNCYAEALVNRLPGNFGHPFSQVKLHLKRLEQVGRMHPHVAGVGRRAPFLCFVNSMSDFWHADVPDEAIHTALDVFEQHPTTVFQILTKRPVRMSQMVAARFKTGVPDNLWFGVSVEDNRVAGRINVLRRLKQKVGKMTAFLSVEPIIGPTDELSFEDIDWSIHGGESGPKARIMQAPWLLAGIENARKAGAAVWLKQHGQVRSNPLLHHAPKQLGVTAQFKWLVDNRIELLPDEKGGATLEGGVTHRKFPQAYDRIVELLNAGRLI